MDVFALQIQRVARGMLSRKANKGRVSLDSPGIELKTITDATGSPLEAARMRGNLRCVAWSFNSAEVSVEELHDERILRDVMSKMRTTGCPPRLSLRRLRALQLGLASQQPTISLRGS